MENKIENDIIKEQPLNYEFLSQGGYGNIYYNSNIDTIVKIQPLYSSPESNIIYESSLIEAIITNSLKQIDTIPKINNIEINYNTSNIHYYMPYYGKSLDKFNNKEILQKNAIPIILSLVETCYKLYLNGVQHTDIKPGNIVISDDFKEIKLIDLNIVSIKSSNKNNYGWSYGIGTWCYSEPSIIFDEEPSDTAMVWSIAFIIAYIYGDHPLLEYYPQLYRYERKDWKNILNSMRKKYRTCFPLTKRHTAIMNPDLYYIFNICTQWDWNKRPTIGKLHELMIHHFSSTNDYIKIDPKLELYNNKKFKPYYNKIIRTIYFNIVYNICKVTNTFDILCRILILIDLYPDDHTDYSIIGCIYIGYIISNNIVKILTTTYSVL
jgi:serine/threonine protein kinase